MSPCTARCPIAAASGKDTLLLRTSPHLVLDGIQLAAEAVNATQAFLCTHHDHMAGRTDTPYRQLHAALDERATAGVDRIPVGLFPVPPRFLAGEATALVNTINGGEAIPRFTPPASVRRRRRRCSRPANRDRRFRRQATAGPRRKPQPWRGGGPTR
nr:MULTISPECIES: hypothetical protein [unclassified Frankia]